MINWLDLLIEKSVKQKEQNSYFFEDFSTIFVYGTGTFARDVYHVIVSRGLPVQGFIDHLPHSNNLFGVPIYTPEKAVTMTKAIKNTIVVLGIHNYQANVLDIGHRLITLGFNKIVNPIVLYDIFGRELGTRYWLTSRDYYFPLQNTLKETYSLWADEASRTLFQSVMEFRLTGNTAKLPEPDFLNPYHPADIPAWKTPLRFVDCGAFNGDTLQDFIKSKISLQSVAAFEPDLINYNALSNFVSSHKAELPDINIFPCGVYSSTIQVSFETGQNMASAISNKGNTIIQCVALDDAIPTFAPNLIKMDIEGAEYDALLGARHIIETHAPGLAVSLYHKPEHLWQLPN